ncbi:MAG TPA: tRNA preQ1(34) S-adenosylmethionine ribosyltransferase-isomerase QueA, partial [Spirochaetes bacterium]|nr:tRNA preQ1(34) S-adenosylmethionine ribosyltransferase-isomerase QueA [Spirochaetota bacterium]
MDAEHYTLKENETDKINRAIQSNKRVITVGTTATRVLEHSFNNEMVGHGEGYTGLFIYPGYSFKVVNTLVTNFHMPRSTPYLLTSAFGGTGLIKEAYHYAITHQFKFFSYG